MPPELQQITVDLKTPRDDSYTVYIGDDALDVLPAVIGASGYVDRCVLISDSTVRPIYAERVIRQLERLDVPVDTIAFQAGEASKTMGTVSEIVGRLVALGASRKSFLVALGGGVVGDVTGFAASIFKRGIGYIQVPTSLIAQVDSSLGGKTGVDTREGKNLVGTFYHPKGVVIDPSFLSTLPEREFRNGLSEVIKYAIIADKELFELMKTRSKDILSQKTDLLHFLVERSCTIKARIVEADEREGDLRRILNFGHTVGHALEAASAYRTSHGEAVATGMVAAAMISERLGHLKTVQCEEIVSLIRRYDLPVTISREDDPAELLRFMARDKKVSGQRIHWVLVEQIGSPFVTPDVPRDVVHSVLEILKQ
jgi:3-dehydroquinate synthase